MGQILSEPITTKSTSTHNNIDYKVGISSMQGWRVQMEDEHSCYLNFPGDSAAAYFAVFDGHGGAEVAKFAGQHLYKKIFNQPEYAEGKYSEAIRKGFLALDSTMLQDSDIMSSFAGSTAIVVLIRDKMIITGNAGDSRAIACVAGQVQTLSNDHRPTVESEKKRILHAGGWVDCNRVNGNLALSRAFGDFEYKKNNKYPVEEQIVTANPEISQVALTKDHEFLVIACDGIWDVLTNEEVVHFVRTNLANGLEPQTICELLMTRCLATRCDGSGIGCDNMTVIIVCFLHGQPFDSLVANCAKPMKLGGIF